MEKETKKPISVSGIRDLEPLVMDGQHIPEPLLDVRSFPNELRPHPIVKRKNEHLEHLIYSVEYV